MAHRLTYSEWIDNCPNKHTIEDANKLCLQVVYDFLFKVVSNDSAFNKSREYFRGLSQPLTEIDTNPAALLREFRRLRRTMKGIPLNFKNRPVTFANSAHATVSITPKEWKGERVTALDQYARYLCGIDSECALQVDHIRRVYGPHIKLAKRNGIPFEINVLDNLIVLDAGKSKIVEALTRKKSLQYFSVARVSKDEGVTLLHLA